MTHFIPAGKRKQIAKRATQVRKMSNGNVSLQKSLDIAAIEAGFLSWNQFLTLEKNQNRPDTAITVQTTGGYLQEHYSNGCQRLKSDLTWRTIGYHDDPFLPEIDYFCPSDSDALLKDGAFIKAIGIIDEISEDEIKLVDICSMLATLKFKVFRSIKPALPDYLQFKEAMGPIYNRPNIYTHYEYIFLDSRGQFSLSPKICKNQETYCLKYNPNYSVHQKISFLPDQFFRNRDLQILYTSFIEAWIYHINERETWIPALGCHGSYDISNHFDSIPEQYENILSKWKADF